MNTVTVTNITGDRARSDMSMGGWLADLRINLRGQGCTASEASNLSDVAFKRVNACEPRRKVRDHILYMAQGVVAARRRAEREAATG